jgi:hypothetical protein
VQVMGMVVDRQLHDLRVRFQLLRVLLFLRHKVMLLKVLPIHHVLSQTCTFHPIEVPYLLHRVVVGLNLIGLCLRVPWLVYR